MAEAEGSRAAARVQPLPGPERRDWQLAALRELLVRARWLPFVCPPIVPPQRQCSPVERAAAAAIVSLRGPDA